MNKLLLACLIACFQVHASMFLLEPFFILYTLTKEHVIGPMDIRQQYNGFVESALLHTANYAVGKITREKVDKVYINKVYINKISSYTEIVSVSLKVKNGKSATILARIAGHMVAEMALKSLKMN